MVMAAPELTVRLDREGMVVALLPAMRIVPGLVPEEITGRHYLDCIYQEERSRVQRTVALLLNGDVQAVELVFRINRHNGKSAWIGGRAAPWYAGDRLLGVQGVLRFIAGGARRPMPPGHGEQKAQPWHWLSAEAWLAQCGMPVDVHTIRRQLVQAEWLSAIGALTASIAHQFSNNLCGIRSVIERMTRKAAEAADRDLLRMALAHCDHMHGLIRSVRQCNLPFSGVHALFDLHHAIDSTQVLLDNYLSVRNTVVLREFCATPLVLCGCESQIRQVLLRLIKSRADAMSEQGGAIRIKTERTGDTVRIILSDIGSGIRQDAPPHLCTPGCFGPAAVEHNGLGLLVSHDIVKAHGGDILVASPAEQGVIITVILPAGSSRYQGDRHVTPNNHSDCR